MLRNKAIYLHSSGELRYTVPSLQLLYANHHVEMTLRILLNDIAHVIRLSRLLRFTRTLNNLSMLYFTASM